MPGYFISDRFAALEARIAALETEMGKKSKQKKAKKKPKQETVVTGKKKK